MSIRKRVDSLLRHFEQEFIPHNRIEVSRSALLHNFDLFGRLSGKAVIPVLKGNAYGHGIEHVVTALAERNMPYIAVDGYFEALQVREVSDVPVLIMGAIAPENFAHIKYDNFAFVVQDEATIRALGDAGQSAKVHLECNTGMNRYGAQPGEVEALTKLILSYDNLTLEGVMSHLADADGVEQVTVDAAVGLYDTCVEKVLAAGASPTIFHVAQTAGSVRANSRYATAIRLGIGLYGCNPFAPDSEYHDTLSELKPAMRFISTITKITELQADDKVSYNYTFTTPKAMKMAVLPVGYYEGVSRALSNVGTVKIHNHDAQIIGRVCMNHTMVSLEDMQAQVGDEVVVYSNRKDDVNTIDAISQRYDLFNYSMLTSLSKDVRRILAS